jgi:dystonin
MSEAEETLTTVETSPINEDTVHDQLAQHETFQGVMATHKSSMDAFRRKATNPEADILYQRFDSNHDGMLTREDFIKGLKASGLAMSQIELEKIADHFDRDKDGYIDLSSQLRGQRRARSLTKEQPVSDSGKIDLEIQYQVCTCTCTKKFTATGEADGKYRFGDSLMLRQVKILRSGVIVRVGGGWDPLEEFLRKHDPCRAT